MQTLVRVIKQGNSLVLPLTKQLKQLGLKDGDWVKITIEDTGVKDEPKPTPKYDPSKVGKMVLRTMEKFDSEDWELRKIIESYDNEPSHVESILRYVLDSKKELEERKSP